MMSVSYKITLSTQIFVQSAIDNIALIRNT